MTIPNRQFIDNMHEHQRDFFEFFDRLTPRAKQQLAWCFWLEWSRRHYKTTLAINLTIREACSWEKTKYLYLSPYQSETRKMVWDDPIMLKSALPDKREMDWTTNETKMLVTFANGSLIQFGGADEPDSWRGNDCLGAVLDERAQMKEEIWTEILMPIIMGKLPLHLQGVINEQGQSAYRWVLSTYTPKGINHATLGFDKACLLADGGVLPVRGIAPVMKQGFFASRLDAEECDIMTPQALSIAKEELPLVIYEQEFRCKRTTQEERTLITSAMLSGMDGINWEFTRMSYPDKRRIVSIDPAFGGDMCDLKAGENTRILEHKILQPHLTNEIVACAKLMAQNIGTKNFIVDCIGNGKGVADALQTDEAMYNVHYFNSAEKPTDAPTKKGERKSLFANKRAQMAYYVAQEIRAGRVESINQSLSMTEASRRELFRQIPMATRYKVNGSGQIILLPKDEIKKELSCSPDSAESWEMMVYGLQFVDPVGSEQIVKERPGRGVYVPYYIGG
jgi:hypothetical protein